MLLAQEYSDKGDLIPDELVDAMVEKRLQEPDAKRGFILDGYPRTVGQAEALNKYMDVDAVINITLPTHVLMEKLLGRRACEQCGRGFNVAAIHDGDLDMPPLLPKKGDCDKCDGEPTLLTRKDDTEDIVKNRLEVYQRETAPVLDFYRGKGKTQDFAVKKGIDDVPRLFKDLGVTVVDA